MQRYSIVRVMSSFVCKNGFAQHEYTTCYGFVTHPMNIYFFAIYQELLMSSCSSWVICFSTYHLLDYLSKSAVNQAWLGNTRLWKIYSWTDWPRWWLWTYNNYQNTEDKFKNRIYSFKENLHSLKPCCQRIAILNSCYLHSNISIIIE